MLYSLGEQLLYKGELWGIGSVSKWKMCVFDIAGRTCNAQKGLFHKKHYSSPFKNWLLLFWSMALLKWLIKITTAWYSIFFKKAATMKNIDIYL